MRDRNIQREIDRINFLISKSKLFVDSNEFDTPSDWAKYLCVLVSGFMENSLEALFSEYARRQLSGPIRNFVISNLRINNPKSYRFYEVSGRFKKEWEQDLRAFLEKNGREEALNTIMSNRHLIAHGRSQDSRITVSQVSSYFLLCIEIIEFIEDMCDL